MLNNKQWTIGITFGWNTPEASIFSMGVGQTCLFLKCLLEKIPEVKEVVFVQNHPLSSPRPKGLLTQYFPNTTFIDINEAYDRVDLWIEGLFRLGEPELNHLHEKGAKAIAFYVGANYVIDGQGFLAQKSNPGFHKNAALFDGAWMFPHIELTSGDYLSVLHRQSVEVVPYIWDPYFVNLTNALGGQKEPFHYHPHAGAKRLVIMEPNTNFSKLFLLPLLISEQLERTHPSLIDSVTMLNTKKYQSMTMFKDLVHQLDLQKAQKLHVESSKIVPLFMQKHGDILVTHQVGLERNNVYFEMLYGAFPLVHNSSHLNSYGLGYFYPDFSITKGASALQEAIESHDAHLEAYVQSVRPYLIDHAPFNPKNIEAYREKLLSVVG